MRLPLISVVLLSAVSLSLTVDGAPASENSAAADTVRSWLDQRMKSIQIHIQPKVVPINDERVDQTFPDDYFFAVYIPRRPVAIRPPEGLLSESLICVHKDGSVEAIPGWNGLKTFLEHNLVNVRNDSQARAALQASFVLAASIAKDGPYEFEPAEVSVLHTGDHLLANAKAQLRGPARGDIFVTAEFGSDGTVDSDTLKIEGTPRPGGPPDYPSADSTPIRR